MRKATVKKARYFNHYFVSLGEYLTIGVVHKVSSDEWIAKPYTRFQGEEETTTHKTRKDAVAAILQAVRDNEGVIHGHGTQQGTTRDISEQLARYEA